MVKEGLIFEHFKGRKYVLKGIVHPSSEMPKKDDSSEIKTIHAETRETVRIRVFYIDYKTRVFYAVDVDEYLVLYQLLDGKQLFVRPIGVFFEHVVGEDNLPVKRFSPVEPEVKTYRKKPVKVEAMKWDGVSLTKAIDFSGSKNLTTTKDGKLKIHTLEGVMEAEIGDYIIKGIKGEVYPCKPDIFNIVYEEADHRMEMESKGKK